VEEQGFVSKNDRIEKADRKNERPGCCVVAGIMVWYSEIAANKASEPSLVRHFTAGHGGYPAFQHGFRMISAGLSALLKEKPLKNNIRSAHGTPIDSGRFRHAVNIRKKKCADKYCCLDC
jgi:hypothetical protein